MPNDTNSDRDILRLAALEEVVRTELGIHPPTEVTRYSEAAYAAEIRAAIQNLKRGVR